MSLRLFVSAGLVGGVLLAGCGREPDGALEDRRAENVAGDLDRLGTQRLAFTRRLTLDECIHVALRYNLENAIQRRRQAIQEEVSGRAWYRMLPDLRYAYRQEHVDEVPAKTATDLGSGLVTKDHTYSTPDVHYTRSLNLAWNLLDFGISFCRARQARARAELEGQRLRRARQDLAFRVTEAYWRTQAARRSAELAEGLMERIRERQKVVQRRIRDNTIPRREGLDTQKRLLTVLGRLKQHRRDYEGARAELLLLLGMQPGTPMQLSPVDFAEVRRFNRFDVGRLEAEAMLNRPELYEQDIEERIRRDDVRVAVREMLPSPSLVYRYDWNQNPFLRYDQWYTLAIQAATDLLSLPAKASVLRGARLEADYVRELRMALAVGILSQLRLAIIEYHEAADRVIATSRTGQIDRQLETVTAALAEQGQATEAELLQAEIDAFFAQLQHTRAYADLRITVARIRNTIGRDPGQLVDPLPVTIRKERAVQARQEQTVWRREQIRKMLDGYRRPPEKYGVSGEVWRGMPQVIRDRGGEYAPPPVEEDGGAPVEDDASDDAGAPDRATPAEPSAAVEDGADTPADG